MASYYFVLVDKRDSKKFRMFNLSKFNKKIKHILTKHNSKSIWSFHKGHVKKNIWGKISKNEGFNFINIGN